MRKFLTMTAFGILLTSCFSPVMAESKQDAEKLKSLITFSKILNVSSSSVRFQDDLDGDLPIISRGFDYTALISLGDGSLSLDYVGKKSFLKNLRNRMFLYPIYNSAKLRIKTKAITRQSLIKVFYV